MAWEFSLGVCGRGKFKRCLGKGVCGCEVVKNKVTSEEASWLGFALAVEFRGLRQDEGGVWFKDLCFLHTRFMEVQCAGVCCFGIFGFRAESEGEFGLAACGRETMKFSDRSYGLRLLDSRFWGEGVGTEV